MKKIFFVVLSLLTILIAVASLYKFTQGPLEEGQDFGKDCAFCNETVLESQKIYENEWVVALLSYKPIVEGHVLIIPKRHVERFEMLLEEEVLQINHLIKQVHSVSQKKYDSFSYMLLQKNGREVGQSVPHVHFHYIPQKVNDSPNTILWNFLIDPLKRPMNQEQIQDEAFAYEQEFSIMYPEQAIAN